MFNWIPGRLLEGSESQFGTALDEFMAAFPEEVLRQIGNEKTRWRVEPGAKGTGRWALAILAYNRETQETIAFGAVECDDVPEHEHPGGEEVYTLAGCGKDVTDEGRHVKLYRGMGIIHAVGTTHAPGAKRLWVFVFRHPSKGIRFTGRKAP
jgi:anti-sigma factor ChrR (cupin superfamily)